MAYYDLNVQCFAKRKAEIIFDASNDPELLYVSHVRPVTNSHPRILHSHSHHVELLLICSGTSEFFIHGQKYPVKPGDLIIYNPGIVHDDLTGPDCDIGYYCVAVGGLRMPGLPENALIEESAGFLFEAGEHFETLHTLCELMFQSLSVGAPGAETFCRNVLHAFLVRALTVTRGIPETAEAIDDDDNILGNRIKEYIDEHYSEPLTLQSIGDALNASPYYISHVFKRVSGYSPIQYLLRRRLGEAQTLLISTSIPISEIAGMVGFDTQNYFNAQFTKNVGIPPKKYRENYVVRSGEKK